MTLPNSSHYTRRVRLSASERQKLRVSPCFTALEQLREEYRRTTCVSPTDFVKMKGFRILSPSEIPPDVQEFAKAFLALQEAEITSITTFEDDFLRTMAALEEKLVKGLPLRMDVLPSRKRMTDADDVRSSFGECAKLSKSEDDLASTKHNGRFQPWVRNALQDWYQTKKVVTFLDTQHILIYAILGTRFTLCYARRKRSTVPQAQFDYDTGDKLDK